MENVTITSQLFNAIIQYIGTKPYAEVFQLIGAIEKELAPKEQEQEQEQIEE